MVGLESVLFLCAVFAVGSGHQQQKQCPTTCFCDFKLSLISCSSSQEGNKSSIPAALLHPNTGDDIHLVRRLDYRDLAVPRLVSGHVQHFVLLTELGMVRCGVADIENATFVNNRQMERIDLSQNLLTKLTQEMFAGLLRLKSLDLSSNQLTQIVDVFSPLAALEQLNLRANALVTFKSDTFKGLSQLQYLNADANNVSVMAESAFQHLDSLSHLILSHNPLTELRHLDLFAARPTSVDLSSSRLRRVPNVIARYVRDLRMSGNSLGRLHRGDFENLVQVRLLVLNDNNITDMEEDTLGRMEMLEQLFLSENLLSGVPASLPSTCLTALHLDGNRITAIGAQDLGGFLQLVHLHLARNSIQSIETAAFDQLTSLARLELQDNRISVVSRRTFGAMPRLRYLDLSRNPIVSTQSLVLQHLPNLRIIHSENDLMETEWSSDFPKSWTSNQLRATSARATETPTGSNASLPRANHSLTVESTPRTGAVQSESNASADSAVGATPPALFPSFAVIAAPLLLGLVAALSLTFCLKRSSWSRAKFDLVLWKRRGGGGGGGGVGVTSVANRVEKSQVVKVGWTVGDVECWNSSLLLSYGDETEHERLLLAVTPHRTKSDFGTKQM